MCYCLTQGILSRLFQNNNNNNNVWREKQIVESKREKIKPDDERQMRKRQAVYSILQDFRLGELQQYPASNHRVPSQRLLRYTAISLSVDYYICTSGGRNVEISDVLEKREVKTANFSKTNLRIKSMETTVNSWLPQYLTFTFYKIMLKSYSYIPLVSSLAFNQNRPRHTTGQAKHGIFNVLFS